MTAPVDQATNTDGAMPELPVVGALWNYIGADPMRSHFKPCARALHEMNPDSPPYPDTWQPIDKLVKLSDARAAIQQAAGAVPEGEIVVTKTDFGAIVAVTRQDSEGRILEVIAQDTQSGSSDHSVPCAGGRVQAWQPIETAPKASKAILVHCADRKNTYTATWARDEEFPWSGKWKHFPGGFIDEAPTHWMPLPPPPATRHESPTGQMNKPAGQGMEIADSRCDYMMFRDQICNKCGRLHDGGSSPSAQTKGPT